MVDSSPQEHKGEKIIRDGMGRGIVPHEATDTQRF